MDGARGRQTDAAFVREPEVFGAKLASQRVMGLVYGGQQPACEMEQLCSSRMLRDRVEEIPCG